MPLDYVRLPRLLFPAPGIDLARFAVIACDQFTAEPAYWEETERLAGTAPSCLRLTLPEVYLSADNAPRAAAVCRAMDDCLLRGVLRELPEGLMLVERGVGCKTPRRGVLLSFDLEAYDETPGADAPIRPTEETVADRVPPRLAVRESAPFELPHILLFADDPAHALLEPLFEQKSALPPLYDFELMQGGGRVTGRFAAPDADVRAFLSRLSAHAARAQAAGAPVFATGDGNHSMAAAKAHWERIRPGLSPAERRTHPARFVLAELVNLWDESIRFEAVHRLLLHVDPADAKRFVAAFPAAPGEIAAARMQRALDAYLAARPEAEIDYIHGADALRRLSAAPGCAGFTLPDFPKERLFPYVLSHGVLPRKTFSMGAAREKRYYLEGRKIR